MSTLRNRTKHDPQRSGMTHAKWREVRSIGRKSVARYIWGPTAVNKNFPGGLPDTYNVGRNATKRATRAESRAH